MKLTSIHYTVVAGFLVGLGGILSTMTSWHQLETPLGLGGILVQLAAVVTSLFAASVAKPS
jgi:hypothetical protein